MAEFIQSYLHFNWEKNKILFTGGCIRAARYTIHWVASKKAHRFTWIIMLSCFARRHLDMRICFAMLQLNKQQQHLRHHCHHQGPICTWCWKSMTAIPDIWFGPLKQQWSLHGALGPSQRFQSKWELWSLKIKGFVPKRTTKMEKTGKIYATDEYCGQTVLWRFAQLSVPCLQILIQI